MLLLAAALRRKESHTFNGIPFALLNGMRDDDSKEKRYLLEVSDSVGDRLQKSEFPVLNQFQDRPYRNNKLSSDN